MLFRFVYLFPPPPAPRPNSAFSALEGLGLQLDPKYSIVNECFPYLARRLLTEDSERMHKMLRTFLYGKEGRYLQARGHTNKQTKTPIDFCFSCFVP